MRSASDVKKESERKLQEEVDADRLRDEKYRAYVDHVERDMCRRGITPIAATDMLSLRRWARSGREGRHMFVDIACNTCGTALLLDVYSGNFSDPPIRVASCVGCGRHEYFTDSECESVIDPVMSGDVYAD